MNFKEFKTKYEKVPTVQYPNSIQNKPLVSICVQTYQHELYIEKCLDSLINQKTNFDYEILIGEDCSDDLTRRICIDYARFQKKSDFFCIVEKIILRLMNSTQAVLMCYIIYIHPKVNILRFAKEMTSG